MANLTSEKESLKKDVETKNTEMLEKNKTITQVKKIGRRYKTQYEELKSQHDKVAPPFWWQQAEELEKGMNTEGLFVLCFSWWQKLPLKQEVKQLQTKTSHSS